MQKLLWFLVPICCSSWFFHQQPITIWLAGDSTMQPYDTSRTPQRGWGQELYRFFDHDIIIKNKARGGRSTKTFINEGLWQQLIDSLQPGDWVFIQFGHNDHSSKPERYTSPDQYQDNLKKMVMDVLQKQAHPVLLTPIAMRTFDQAGHYHDGHGAYPDKVRQLAKEMHVPLIDLDKSFGEAIAALGPDSSKAFFMNFVPGMYPGYPQGHQDNTHLRETGALLVAWLTIHDIQKLQLHPLDQHIRKVFWDDLRKKYEPVIQQMKNEY
ncbi:rhamnogalacturonan acetylesterase [Thermoflavifilum thermophilum]|uniref:Lysophospholipase L1 n=1 Tax=Thermoflavifilum thermophilum TaxID=1393122 RepID=A0A1I7NIZ1_9BACT|nr:rhamnogalacturonan acetylesterase [Thermoflavifilum thermophilum]SFV34624.1 Lysophospholipase L1 [Thermoflavifilum thermophilum]